MELITISFCWLLYVKGRKEQGCLQDVKHIGYLYKLEYNFFINNQASNHSCVESGLSLHHQMSTMQWHLDAHQGFQKHPMLSIEEFSARFAIGLQCDQVLHEKYYVNPGWWGGVGLGGGRMEPCTPQTCHNNYRALEPHVMMH